MNIKFENLHNSSVVGSIQSDANGFSNVTVRTSFGEHVNVVANHALNLHGPNDSGLIHHDHSGPHSPFGPKKF